MLLWLAASDAATGVTHAVSGTTVATLATDASHVRHLPYVSTPADKASGGISMLGGGGTTGLSS